jgi:hypothetical protein
VLVLRRVARWPRPRLVRVPTRGAAALNRALAGTQPAAAATLLARPNALSRPDADLSAGGWTTHLGGTTDLWQVVDEAAADDADYVQSVLDPTADTLILSHLYEHPRRLDGGAGGADGR